MALSDSDAVIRKVKVLQGRAREEAEKQHLKEDDLVLVTSPTHSLPEYKVEKIEGDPLSFLLGGRKK